MENLQLMKKFNLVEISTGLNIHTEKIQRSKDLHAVFKKIHDREGNNFQEFFYVLFLNRNNCITGYYIASMGGITGTVADPRLILKAALLAHCTAIAVSHNHPSGNLIPSRADEEITQKIKNAAAYLDINIIDHVILTDTDQYFSFADDGIL